MQEQMESDRQILERYVEVLSKLNEMQIADVGVSVSDLEQILYYRPARSLTLKVTAGDALKPGTAIHRTISEGRRISIQVDASVYGVPYVVVSHPILNRDGKIIGATAINESTQRYEALKKSAGLIGENIGVIAGTTEEISAQAQEMAAASARVSDTLEKSEKLAKDTDQIINLIKMIAGQTNLLGLNAAIEAARVGDQGRGFGVVAVEIRKLAATTTESIKNIDGVIRAIQSNNQETRAQMRQNAAMIAEVSIATTQVAEATQQLNEMAVNCNCRIRVL